MLHSSPAPPTPPCCCSSRRYYFPMSNTLLFASTPPSTRPTSISRPTPVAAVTHIFSSRLSPSLKLSLAAKQRQTSSRPVCPRLPATTSSISTPKHSASCSPPACPCTRNWRSRRAATACASVSSTLPTSTPAHSTCRSRSRPSAPQPNNQRKLSGTATVPIL